MEAVPDGYNIFHSHVTAYRLAVSTHYTVTHFLLKHALYCHTLESDEDKNAVSRPKYTSVDMKIGEMTI